MTSSIGSCRRPVAGSVANSTRGREIDNSKPSRRIVSIKTPSCNSPRPATSKASFSRLSRTWIATFPSASRNRRSPITREVTFAPSRPASGLSLTEKVIARVGGSIGSAASGAVTSGAQIVSATVVSASPATAMMSPACASSIGRRSSPRNACNLVSRACSTTWPSRPSDLTGMLTRATPE